MDSETPEPLIIEPGPTLDAQAMQVFRRGRAKRDAMAIIHQQIAEFTNQTLLTHTDHALILAAALEAAALHVRGIAEQQSRAARSQKP